MDDVCERGYCHDYGYYDNTTSVTFRYISSGFTNGVINHGEGAFINDTLRFGDAEYPNMQLGMVVVHTTTIPIKEQLAAIAGLGMSCATRKCDSDHTMIQQLYDRKFIDSRAFSLYLGPNEESATGELLLGGINLARRNGSTFKVNMVDPLDPAVYNMPNRVYVHGYRIETNKNDPAVFPSTNANGTITLLDSGSPRMYLPQAVFDFLITYFGVSKDGFDPNSTHYRVDCKFRKKSKDTMYVRFDGGKEIAVPLHTLPTKVGGDKCFLDIGRWDGLLGDPFLRSTYATFNYDDLTVEMSQANYAGGSNIVKI